MKKHYSDYVSHCMRFYLRFPNPYFSNDIDELNWNTCKKVLSTYSTNDKDTLIQVYGKDYPIKKVIEEVATSKNINFNKVWSLIIKFESDFAKERRL